MIKRLLFLYLVAGLVGLAAERSGKLSCYCRADCWCKRPGLNVFRWIFPIGHREGQNAG